MRKLTKSGKYKTHVVKGDMGVMLGPGFPIFNTFGYPGLGLGGVRDGPLAHLD